MKLRLCGILRLVLRQPPSGGCVLKHIWATKKMNDDPSRLQAAVC